MNLYFACLVFVHHYVVVMLRDCRFLIRERDSKIAARLNQPELAIHAELVVLWQGAILKLELILRKSKVVLGDA